MKKFCNIINIAFIALMLSSCEEDYGTLSGTPEKTPLLVSSSIDLGSSVSTRAANNKFEKEDEFMVCLRHVYKDNTNAINEVSLTSPDEPTASFHPRAYATFKFNSNLTDPENGSNENKYYDSDFSLSKLKFDGTELTGTSLKGLYWDDFSSGGKGDDTDLRTDNHYLQSYYGYCFNGASSGTGDGEYTLTEDSGLLTWKIQTDQTSEDNYKKSDLLWSTSQTPVSYSHGSSSSGDHNTINVPFTHALSKISINVTVDTDAGFVASNNLFDNVDIDLASSFRTSCKLTPTTGINSGTIDYSGANTGTIKMCKTKKTQTSANYEAIVVPSELTLSNEFATITVDGNKYTIPVTEKMLQKGSVHSDLGWGDQLSETSPYQMKQGVHYALKVTLQKSKIGLTATIIDWDKVFAEGKGDITFSEDVISCETSGKVITTDGAKFTLWRSKTNETDNSYDEDSSTDGINPATTCTYSDNNWTCDPKIYWENGSTNFYFRALSKHNDTNYLAFTGENDQHESTTDLAVYQGTDLLWGTTAAHKGNYIEDGTEKTKEYAAGDPINPRTGNVPIQFEHIMSKITIKLETATEDAAKVDFYGAKIEISNLSTSGTIALKDGEITPGSNVNAAFSTTHTTTSSALYELTIVNGEFFIPQTIADNAKIKLTLKDGTTYSLQLNKCQVTKTDEQGNSTTSDLTTWTRGNHYTYTIHVEKEQITFRALIKEWEETSGSGNATLDWD